MNIDQLSFFGPEVATGPPSSLLDLYPPVVTSLLRVNYVATCSLSSSSDSVVVHCVLGALGPDFRDVVLPSAVELLEDMTCYSS